MVDKVLHRKLFRQKALRAGKVEPVRAVVGGIAAGTPAALSLAARVGPFLARQVKKLVSPRVKRGVMGALETSEVPYGAYQVGEGMLSEEGDMGDVAGGLAFLGAGSGTFLPGARRLASAFGKKDTRGISRLRRRAEQTPYLGKVLEKTRKNPGKSFLGAAGIAGAGEVLGSPLSEEELKTQQILEQDQLDNLKKQQEIRQQQQEKVQEGQTRKADPNFQGDVGPFTSGGPPGELKSNLAIEDERIRRAKTIEDNDSDSDVAGKLNESGKEAIGKTKQTFDNTNPRRLSSVSEIARQLKKEYQVAFDDITAAREKLSQREKQNFDEYLQKFKEYSGADNNNRAMYLLWKMGSGLANAKTSNRGFLGLLEAANQAGGEVMETAFALNQEDKKLRQSLAANFLDYERTFEEQQRLEGKALDKEQRLLTQSILGTAIDLDQKAQDRQIDVFKAQLDAQKTIAKNSKIKERNLYLSLNNPDHPDQFGGIVDVPAVQLEDGTLGVEINNQIFALNSPEVQQVYGRFGKRGGNEKGDYAIRQFDGGKADEVLSGIQYTGEGINIINDVLEIRPTLEKQGINIDEVVGAGGALREKGIKVVNFLKGLPQAVGIDVFGREGPTANDILQKSGSSDVLGYISKGRMSGDPEQMTMIGFATERSKNKNDPITAQELQESMARDYKNSTSPANMNALAKEVYGTSFENLIDDSDSTADTKKITIAKLAVYQHKLKYLIANALKAQDRLTRADIDDAEGQTSIIDLFKDFRTVEAQMLTQKQILENNFTNQLQRYRGFGGTAADILANPNLQGLKVVTSRQMPGQQAATVEREIDGDAASANILETQK